MKCKTDEADRHKDGSAHHHPMRIFPIEEQVQHLAIAPSLVIPLRLQPNSSGGMADCALLSHRHPAMPSQSWARRDRRRRLVADGPASLAQVDEYLRSRGAN